MVHLTDVSKYFGDKRALGPVSAEIPRGSTVGFLGLNGVGKTTLLRILACDLRPSAGTVRIAGVDALQDPHAVRRRVGYLPELPPLYGDMTVGDYLAFVGRIKGVAPGELPARVREAEERTSLTDVHRELTRNLSHGYQQRVGIAQAIIHGPELLILDEPTQGLDPVQIVEMRDLISELKDEHTILISSHILHEISRTCDRILVLNAGRIIASGSEDELSSRLLGVHRASVSVRAAAGVASETVATLLSAIPDVTAVEPAGTDGDVLSFVVESRADCRAEACRRLVEAGHDVVALGQVRRELEGLFVELVGEVEPPVEASA